MRTSAIFFRYSLATTLLLAGAGCDRLQPSPPKPKEAQWVSESISLSLDSLLDTAVANEAREVDEAHKKGHPNTVGSRDGKWWLESNALMRIAYVNAIGDLVSTLSGINVATSGAMESQKRLKTLDYNFESGTFGGPVDAESQFSSRIQEVIAGRSFGDLVEAITKFYQNKPLLKDKPVLWVLAGPLYKDLQEAKPQDKRSRYDLVVIPMRKQVQ